VLDFLGNVNVFQGRVQNGRAQLGAIEVAYPEYPHAEPRDATVYFRPHELDILHHRNGEPAMAATIERINSAGAIAKILLTADGFDRDLNVELSKQRYEELGLKTGDRVFVAPRKARVFVPDYVI
jgi:sulfate transport system ATP-binding protein